VQAHLRPQWWTPTRLSANVA